MLTTVQAIVDPDGSVRLLEKVKLDRSSRALVTIFDREEILESVSSSLLSEKALGEDWNRPEEDEAWKPYQRAK